MSRNFVIILVVMCAAVAGLIVFSKMRTPNQQTVSTTQDTTTAPAQPTPTTPSVTPTPTPGVPRVTPQPTIVTPNIPNAATQQSRTTVAGHSTTSPLVPTNVVPETDTDTKPLPVLIQNYATSTNRDDRLDIMMDIADLPGPDSIRALSTLFDAETDNDLKVDLLDSLLGIEGFVDEKLKMLTKGTAKNLSSEVRQSAIDGLIDLDDQRVIPVLNGLLNDPDEEIRESAKDALEMLQSQPAVKIGK